jgi:hypothetical protein
MLGFDMNHPSSLDHRWSWELAAKIIGPYLNGNQLASLCHVSKNVDRAFRPQLWSNPLVILKENNSPICEHLTFAWSLLALL